MKKIVFALGLFSVASLFAFDAQKCAEYKSGDSLAWYHLSVADSFKKSAKTEALLLEIASQKSVTPEAFRYLCIPLKNCASDKSVDVLKKYLTDKNYSASAVDVLKSLNTKAANTALLDALFEADNVSKCGIVGALGTNRVENAVAKISYFMYDKDSEVALSALRALGDIPSEAAVVLLGKFLPKNETLLFARNLALTKQAEFMFKANNKKFAELALSFVPEDFCPAIKVKSEISGEKRMAYLDKIMAQETRNSRTAARLANEGRTYANSAELLKAYPSLGDVGKAVALRSFGLSKDAAFADIIKGELKDSADVKSLQAIYACEFVCTPEMVDILLGLAKSKDATVARAAQYALERNSLQCINEKLMAAFEKDGFLPYLSCAVTRGDVSANEKLFKMFLTKEGAKNSKLTNVFNHQLTIYGVGKMFKMLGTDPVVRKAALRSAIKCLGQERNIERRRALFDEYFDVDALNAAEIQFAREKLFPKKKK